ncbi:MAG TPA: hypothetical protein ENI22_02715 [Candidatus Pacearchaeota archaeon]|nr:hypothetical protein [Candidatus Pacearchaeota archaeon]
MEKAILNVFLYKNKLRFSEIEDKTGLRSNKLAYYLKKLIFKGIVVKNKENYMLSESHEHLIPYITEKQAILPVLLIVAEKKGKYFLYHRDKRPYNDFLSLPGGRILVGENIKKATVRIMKNKFGINSSFKGIKSISLEHVRKNGKIIYSFLLMLVSVSTREDIKYYDLEENRKNMIRSDYLLLKNNLDFNLKVPIINSFVK